MQKIHEFPLGGSVQLTSPQHKVRVGPYTVTRLMPEGRDGELQYRIKNDEEATERVVTETQIMAARAAHAGVFSA